MAPIGMLGWVLGCALQMWQPQLWAWPVYAALAGLGLLAAITAAFLCGARNGRRGGLAAAVLLAAALVGAASTGVRAVQRLADVVPAQWQGRDVQLQAVVDSLPQRTAQGQRWQARVEGAWADGQAIALPQRVALQHYEGAALQVQPGERWLWTVRLRTPNGLRNPHGFDVERWWWTQGIRATGYVRVQPAPQRMASTPHAWVQQWRASVREAMQQPVKAGWLPAAPADAMGVVVALVAGDQAAIGATNWQLFRDTGVAHLVSISGLHITMFAWLATAVLGRLWRRWPRACLWCPAPVAAAWVGWGLALLYAVFSGWGIPAQRTVGMLLAVVLLRTLGLRWPWPLVWLGVLWVLVLWDPWVLLQAGFWLSFVAVGVLFTATAQPSHVPQRPAQPGVYMGQAGVRYLGQLLREQAVLGLALAPLTLLLFGQLSVVGFVANLWAVPWVTLCVTPLAMLGMVWSPLWTVAAWAVQAMLWLLEAMVQWPGAVLYVPQAPWLWALVGLIAAWVMVWRGPWSLRLAGAVWLLPLLLWLPPRPAQGVVELLALDVGQGGAVLLRTARHSLLFDAGPRWGELGEVGRDAGAQTIVPLLRAWGERLDAVWISHADTDHIGGAVSVLQAQPTAALHGSWGVQAALAASAQEVGARRLQAFMPCVQGQQWAWDGVHFAVLHPSVRDAHGAGQRASRNASSCVLLVTAADGTRLLLTGDIEAAQERQLLREGLLPPVALVVVPHHGSRTSSTAAWVQALQPKVAVVQAGYANRFGHPHPTVVQRYAQQGAQVVVSASCGAMQWSSQRPQAVQCERVHAQRYWQRP